ncbi:MAG: hypothetical protein ACPG4F_12600, partial [Paracoccaceae bacterium]
QSETAKELMLQCTSPRPRSLQYFLYILDQLSTILDHQKMRSSQEAALVKLGPRPPEFAKGWRH